MHKDKTSQDITTMPLMVIGGGSGDIEVDGFIEGEVDGLVSGSEEI